MSTLTKQLAEQVQEEDLTFSEGIPVCQANYCSPVVDQANFIDEIPVVIAGRKYIPNAPHF